MSEDCDEPAEPAAMAALKARADRVALRLALAANPRRLLILCRLAEGDASVGDLQRHAGLGQSAVSQHLAKLRAAGIVAWRRDGQNVIYRLSDPEMAELMAALYDVFCREDPS